MTDSRKKGMRGELEAEKVLNSMGVPFIRTYSAQAALGGADGTTSNDQGLVKWEVKRCQRPRIYPWVNQVAAACTSDGYIPAVLWRSNRERWLVVLDLEKAPGWVRVMQRYWHV